MAGYGIAGGLKKKTAAELEEENKKLKTAKFGEGAQRLVVKGGRAVAPEAAPGGGHGMALRPSHRAADPTKITHAATGYPGEEVPMAMVPRGEEAPVPAVGQELGIDVAPDVAAVDPLYSPSVTGDQPAQAPPAVGMGVKLPEQPQVDKGRALRRGALVAGLSMMERGGRAYGTPVSATSVVGTGGLKGVQAYEQDIATQRGEFAKEQKLEAGGIAMAGAKQDLASKPLETETKMLNNEKIRAVIAGYKGDRAVKNMLNQAQLDYAKAETPEDRNAIVKFISDISGKGGDKKGYKPELVFEDVTPEGAFTPERKATKIYDPNTRTLTSIGGEQAKQPSANHVAALRAGKATPEQFDQVYGAGASARIMGQ